MPDRLTERQYRREPRAPPAVEMPVNERTVVQAEIYADVLCPWCFIGKRLRGARRSRLCGDHLAQL